MEVTPKYKVGDVVSGMLRGPNGKYTWGKAEIVSVSMKWVGRQAQAIHTPKGHEIIEGRTLGPLYWVRLEGCALHETARWEYELKDAP